jgi:hypothetical protein
MRGTHGGDGILGPCDSYPFDVEDDILSTFRVFKSKIQQVIVLVFLLCLQEDSIFLNNYVQRSFLIIRILL